MGPCQCADGRMAWDGITGRAELSHCNFHNCKMRSGILGWRRDKLGSSAVEERVMPQQQTVASPEAMVMRAIASTGAARWTDALQDWSMASQVVPFTASFFLTDIGLRLGDLDAVETHAKICSQFSSAADYVTKLSQQAAVIAKRREDFTDIDAASYADSDTMRLTGRTAIECSLWEQAIEVWTMYIDSVGANPEAYRRLGVCYQRLGRYEASVDNLKRSLAIRDDAKVREALERSEMLEKRRFSGAKSHIRRLEQNPSFLAAAAAAADSESLAHEVRSIAKWTGVKIELPQTASNNANSARLSPLPAQLTEIDLGSQRAAAVKPVAQAVTQSGREDRGASDKSPSEHLDSVAALQRALVGEI
jgi:tetratricopeptide (TPR) repeat protein